MVGAFRGSQYAVKILIIHNPRSEKRISAIAHAELVAMQSFDDGFHHQFQAGFRFEAKVYKIRSKIKLLFRIQQKGEATPCQVMLTIVS